LKTLFKRCKQHQEAFIFIQWIFTSLSSLCPEDVKLLKHNDVDLRQSIRENITLSEIIHIFCFFGEISHAIRYEVTRWQSIKKIDFFVVSDFLHQNWNSTMNNSGQRLRVLCTM